jgi:hypothetical protein
MKRNIWLTAALTCVASLAFAEPKGTAPRADAGRYPAHAERDGIAIGARLLSHDEARKVFVSDVNRCCLVLEIAVYPQKDKPFEVSLGDLSLQKSGAENETKASSAKVVAGSLQKQAQGQRDISVYPTTEIGYESGSVYDPATGTRRGSGVYTRSGVGVGIGGRGGPGSTEKDRDAMATELSEKGLPEGSAAAPVAGYVYFPLAASKKKQAYQLNYVVNGSKVTLSLPQP